MKLVIKFGGTSVGTPDALRNAAQVVKTQKQAGHQICVVTSAMSGITDQLVEFSQIAVDEIADEKLVMRIMDFVHGLEDRHAAAVAELIDDEEIREQTIIDIGQECRMLERVLMGLHFLGEVSPSANDLVQSAGERLAAPMLAGIIRSVGVEARAVKGTEAGIITDEHWGEAIPDVAETRKRVPEALNPLIDKGVVPVVTGFYGATPNGRPALLGRGGSDYVAGLIGDALNADEVWIMTDVDGVRSADPRIVPEAAILDTVTWQEAIELAYFGAKVLHPKTLIPLREKGISAYVKNTFQPDASGTVATFGSVDVEHPVRVIANREEIALAYVSSVGFQPDVQDPMALILEPLRRADVPIYVQARSSAQVQYAIALEERHVDQLTSIALPDTLRVHVDRGFSMVTLVGENLSANPKVLEMFVAVLNAHDIHIQAIVGNPKGCSISSILPEGRSQDAVRVLHKQFIG